MAFTPACFDVWHFRAFVELFAGSGHSFRKVPMLGASGLSLLRCSSFQGIVFNSFVVCPFWAFIVERFDVSGQSFLIVWMFAGSGHSSLWCLLFRAFIPNCFFVGQFRAIIIQSGIAQQTHGSMSLAVSITQSRRPSLLQVPSVQYRVVWHINGVTPDSASPA